MGLLDRFSRLVRANINYVVGGEEDPEKALQQAVSDMQGNLVSMRQAVAQAIATQKRTERQRDQANRNAQEWYDRAQLALEQGNEETARTALSRRHSYTRTAQTLQGQISYHTDIVKKLKANMVTLETQMADARMKKDMYIARARAARSSAQLNAKVNGGNHRSSDSVFERMEARVLDLEAQAEMAAGNGAGGSADTVERQFEQLENQEAVNTQLAQLKRRIESRPGSGRLNS